MDFQTILAHGAGPGTQKHCADLTARRKSETRKKTGVFRDMQPQAGRPHLHLGRISQGDVLQDLWAAMCVWNFSPPRALKLSMH